jgi:hypothetical protein
LQIIQIQLSLECAVDLHSDSVGARDEVAARGRRPLSLARS